MNIQKRPYTDLFLPGENVERLRPLEITDIQLDPTIVDASTVWAGDTMSYIPGINRMTDLFLLFHKSQSTSIDTVANIQHHLDLVRSSLDSLPPQLRWRGGLSRLPGTNFGTDAQTANLYISQLHIRYNLLEQMIHVQKPGMTKISTPEIVRERESIVDDMLEIVQHVPREIVQANGPTAVHKIRDIGAALLEQPVSEQVVSPSTQRNKKLRLILDILKELEGQT